MLCHRRHLRHCISGESTLARRPTGMLPSAYRLRAITVSAPESRVRSFRFKKVSCSVTTCVGFSFMCVKENPSTIQRYDWSESGLGRLEALLAADIVAFDLIGLFQPEALPAQDLTLLCARRGRRSIACDSAQHPA